MTTDEQDNPRTDGLIPPPFVSPRVLVSPEEFQIVLFYAGLPPALRAVRAARALGLGFRLDSYWAEPIAGETLWEFRLVLWPRAVADGAG